MYSFLNSVVESPYCIMNNYVYTNMDIVKLILQKHLTNWSHFPVEVSRKCGFMIQYTLPMYECGRDKNLSQIGLKRGIQHWGLGATDLFNLFCLDVSKLHSNEVILYFFNTYWVETYTGYCSKMSRG